jgi:hypothetical protein
MHFWSFSSSTKSAFSSSSKASSSTSSTKRTRSISAKSSASTVLSKTHDYLSKTRLINVCKVILIEFFVSYISLRLTFSSLALPIISSVFHSKFTLNIIQKRTSNQRNTMRTSSNIKLFISIILNENFPTARLAINH